MIDLVTRLREASEGHEPRIAHIYKLLREAAEAQERHDAAWRVLWDRHKELDSENDTLRAVNKNLADLVQQVMDDHANPDSGFHNECDVSPCMWCAGAAAIIAAAKDGK